MQGSLSEMRNTDPKSHAKDSLLRRLGEREGISASRKRSVLVPRATDRDRRRWPDHFCSEFKLFKLFDQDSFVEVVLLTSLRNEYENVSRERKELRENGLPSICLRLLRSQKINAYNRSPLISTRFFLSMYILRCGGNKFL